MHTHADPEPRGRADVDESEEEPHGATPRMTGPQGTHSKAGVEAVTPKTLRVRRVTVTHLRATGLVGAEPRTSRINPHEISTI